MPRIAINGLGRIGKLIFGAIFVVNCSLHSFLILNYTNNDRVTMDVGYYYIANASGRLVGTFLSGVFSVRRFGRLSFCFLNYALFSKPSHIFFKNIPIDPAVR